MIFEYVVSGPSHSVITHQTLENNKMECRRIFNVFNDVVLKKIGNYNIAFLYNGYLEEKLGKAIRSAYGDELKLYVDSGGLQMVTLGHKVTDELKNNVYKVQAECGDYAMSFDEIPVKLLAAKSSRGGMSTRMVDLDNFDNYAKESAKNLKQQIRKFIEYGTSAKPFIIVQGYDLESYQRWANILLDGLTEDELSHIGGISCGAAALGQGQLEDFKRAYICSKIDVPSNIKSHIHLLGVGSISRLIPYVLLSKNGALQTNKISFDSSTHSSALSMANYQRGHKLLSFSGDNPIGFSDIVDELSNFYSEIGISISREHIHNGYLMQNKRIVEMYGEEFRNQHQIQKIANLFCNVRNFISSLDELIANPKDYIVDKYSKTATQCLSFLDVIDDKTFNTWVQYNKSSVKSNSVSFSSTSVEEFFV